MTNSSGAPQQTGQGQGGNGGPRQGGHGGHGLDGFYAALRRPGIVRQSQGRWFAGVANGLARWLGVDPLVVRAGFILFSIFFGMGVALYLVLWLLMPDERGEIHVERALKHGEGGSIFLLVVTAMSVLGGGPWWGGDTRGFRFFGFVLLVVGAWWFLTRTSAGRELRAQAPWRGNADGATGSTGSTSTSGSSSATSATGATSAPAYPGAPEAAPTGPAPFVPGAGVSGPAAPGPVTAYGSTGNAAANAGATLAAPRTPAPTPVHERTPVVGFAGGLLLLGLSILTAVVVSSVAQAAGWSGSHVAVGLASGVGVLGLGILVAGLAGRRAGGLAFFAVVGMIAAAAATATPAGVSQPWQVGDQTHQVTSLTPSPSFELGVGQMQVDLTKADYRATPGTDYVTAKAALGQIDLVVPKGVRVTVNATGRAGALHATGTTQGDVDWQSGQTGMGPGMRNGGMSWSKTVQYGPQSGQPEIVVDAEIGVGEIHVRSAS
ncbi:PspC domain-containing protein [Terrabacter sp. NPDC080008]|uniref:PspC domain-containing protein n=1 Tax=Terrabacter sp. NPDC080008 TaxID=3155176 RepID=UPI003450D1F7